MILCYNNQCNPSKKKQEKKLNTNINDDHKAFPYILIILTTFFWGSNVVAGRFMNGYIPPMTLTCYRWLIVIVMLFPLVIKKLIANIGTIKKHWFLFFILGLTGIALNTGLLYLGLTYTTAISGSLIGATNPIFIILAAFFFLKEPISLRKLIGLLLSIAGVIFIITEGNLSNILHLSFNIGDLIILLAVLVWALYSTLLRFTPNNIDPLLLLFVSAVFSQVFLLPVSIAEQHFEHIAVINQLTIGILIYLAIFPAIFGYLAWHIGLKKIGNTTCGILYNLSIFFSSILAIIFLKEQLHTFHFVGFPLILLGSYLTLDHFFIKK